MTEPDFEILLQPVNWFVQGRGPRYQQLSSHLKSRILAGLIPTGTLLPPERDMASQADVSRVTIRKAIGTLADDGLLDQRQGSGTIVRDPQKNNQRLKQSLSTLESFTETMKLRGYASSSQILARGIFAPTPAETAALGQTAAGSIARITRLRIADPGPLAIETSSVPADILPDPETVDQSLYAVLRKNGTAPVRAVQRISARNLSASDAVLMGLPDGTAVLKIDRTGYLDSGRPVEFTTGLYRSDIYDFITELQLDPIL